MSAEADRQARLVIDQLPGVLEPERQYLQAVARGEGFYGLGWGNPSANTIELSRSLGLTGLEGKGSNNWGADQGQGTAGSFPHVDFGWRNPDGTPWDGKGSRVWKAYVGQYAKYNTRLEGLTRFSRILLKDNVREALARGSLRDAVYAQKANRYFELDPDKYLSAVRRNYGILTTNLAWTPALTEEGVIPLVPGPDSPDWWGS